MSDQEPTDPTPAELERMAEDRLMAKPGEMEILQVGYPDDEAPADQQ